MTNAPAWKIPSSGKTNSGGNGLRSLSATSHKGEKSLVSRLAAAFLAVSSVPSAASIPFQDMESSNGTATFNATAAATWYAESAHYSSNGFFAMASWRAGDTLAVAEDGASFVLTLGSPASGEVAVDFRLSHALGWAPINDAAGNELWMALPSANMRDNDSAANPVNYRMQLFRDQLELSYADNPNGVEWSENPVADMTFFTPWEATTKNITSTSATAQPNSTSGYTGFEYSGSGTNPRSWDRIRFSISDATGTGTIAAGTQLLVRFEGGLLDPVNFGGTATDYWVSTTGSDNNPGTEEAPFASPARALSAARSAKLAGVGAGEPFTIWLGGGRYQMTDGMQLGAVDSGFSTDAPLRFMAMPGEQPVLFGGSELPSTGFNTISNTAQRDRLISTDARNAVLELDLDTHGVDQLGEVSRHGWLYLYEWGLRDLPEPVLVVGGKTMQLARWPNVGETDLKVESIIDAGDDRSSGDLWSGGGTFTNVALSARSTQWQDTGDTWLSGVFGYAWAWSYNKVSSINSANGHVSLAYPEVDAIHTNSWTRSFFHAENIFEEVDTPGEYFIDRDSKKLYLYPPTGFGTGQEPYLTALDEPMILATGASHVHFSGIIFEGGRTHGLRFDNCNGIRIDQCTIRCFSDDGLVFNGSDNVISGSDISEIGSAGIVLDGGDYETLTPGNNEAVNCTIRRNGRWDRAFRPAVTLVGVGNEVRHCLLEDIPHMAIDVTGNDHRIEYNEITDTCQLLDDMCAVYFNTGENMEQRGTVIRRNYFHDIALNTAHSSGAIYLDNMTMGVTICDNVFHRIGTTDAHWTIMNHGGAHIDVKCNMFIDCSMPLYVGFPLTSYFSSWVPDYMDKWQTTFANHGGFENGVHAEKYPELKQFFEGDPLLPETNTFIDNIILADNVQPAVPSGVMVGDGAPATIVESSGVKFGSPAVSLSNKADLAGAPATAAPEAAPYRAEFMGLLPATDSIAPRDWAKKHFGNTTPDWSADPDKDGMPNALEYALGGDPARIDSMGNGWAKDKVVMIDGAPFLELSAQFSPQAALCRCVVQVSESLGDWRHDSGEFDRIGPTTPGEVTLRDSNVFASTQSRYARLALELYN